jgi:hypothetical protein
MSQDTPENKNMKKLQREMSKAGHTAEKMQTQDINASFSNNSETEREKSSIRKPTGAQYSKPKTYKKRKDAPL